MVSLVGYDVYTSAVINEPLPQSEAHITIKGSSDQLMQSWRWTK